MKKGRASSTANGVAIFRAAGHREVSGVRNDDDVVEELIPAAWRAAIAVPPVRAALTALSTWAFPGLHAWQNARTRILDRWLQAELQGPDRPEQLVVVGAGFDTRSLRYADALNGIAVFEVDHEDSQAAKKERLVRARGALPSHVRYIPFNLAATPDLRALDAFGVDRQRPTCFLFEGVSMYLEPAATAAVLSAVGDFAPRSSLLWDCLRDEALRRPSSVDGGARHLRSVARRGEPFRCAFDERSLPVTLRAHNLVVEEVVVAGDVERVLGGPASLFQPGPCCSLFALARARVGSRGRWPHGING